MPTDVARYVPPGVRLFARRAANRIGVEVSRNPFPRRLAMLLAQRGIRHVLDVGANRGQYAVLLRESGYAGDIMSCEPLPDAHADLARRCKSDPLWHTRRLALGERDGTVDVHVAHNSYSSSVLDMLPAHVAAAPDSRYVATQRAPMCTVTALLAELGWAPEDTLLKADVQGYEWQVLAGAPLDRLAAVQAELSLVPLYAGQRLMADVVSTLEGAGLRLWAMESGFCDPHTGRMLQCDGVYVRDGAR